MKEQDTVSPSPREELVALLSQDFRSDEERELDQRPETGELTNTLGAFLIRARAIEDIEERLASDEAAEIAASTGRVLETASITDSFKAIITGYLVQAYVYESRVDDIVSPTSLGILNGEGIFDADSSKGIEAQALRGYLFDIINKQVLVARSEETEEPVIIVRNPAAYAQVMGVFDDWTLDFISTYGEDVFAGIELDAYYIEAAEQAHLVTEEEAKESGWADIVEKLRRLRGEDRPE